MRDKIKHFSKGDFQIKKPDVVFSETNLLCKIGEGEIYNGSFTIENVLDGDIRGLVYPSSFRMRCRKHGFQGNPVKIEFQYDGRDLKPGHVEKGSFMVVCNGGEFVIDFTAIIEKPFVMTSQGKIQSLRGFKRLAFKNYEEAKKIFKSRDFYELVKYEEPKIKNLYDNMRKWNLDDLGMEEFLVGIKQKEKLFLVLDAYERVYRNLEGVYSDSITITKNTWGFLECKIYSDCEFLEPSITNLSTLDFNGMSYEFKYVIKSNYLHAGRNFGNIYIESAFEKICYAVEIDNSVEELWDRRKCDYIMAHFIKNLLKYEGEYISATTWFDKSMKLVNELQAAQPDNKVYNLYQAFVYLRLSQRDEAKWILENYNYNKYAVGRDIEADSFYLYLTALQQKNATNTKKVLEELQKAYLKNPKSWKILCMLIELDPYYKDYYERKHALENQFELGSNNIFVYLSSYKCFRDKCTNLKKLGNFEIQILRFAIKYKLLTKELALYTSNLASQQKVFDRRIMEILEASYNMFPDQMILMAICTTLIKGNQSQNKYFKWFELAVKEEIKIARLFEYYMESVSLDRKEPLHRTILLYFAHGNSLNQEREALLYANIIMHEKENSELYKCYDEKIKIFVMQQLEMRKINENLRILYRKFLSNNEMNIEKIRAIYDITHAYTIKTKVPNMKYLMVISDDGGIYQKVPYTDNGSQVVLDSKDDIIAWESNDGIYYVGSIKYRTERAFNESKYIEMCRQRLNTVDNNEDEEEPQVVDFETLKDSEIDKLDEKRVFQICSKELKETLKREVNQKEDTFLTHALFKVFQKEEYDKYSLDYLVTYFSGSTREMKELWYAAKDYEVDTAKLSERIISQMLFSEVVVGSSEIFEDYYVNGGYFRVIEGYMSYICREHIVRNKILSENIIEIVMHYLSEKFNVSDIIKISMLKYFSDHDYTVEQKEILKLCMQELCEKQLYFKFYMKYGEQWLREVQLWDKTLVSYTSKLGGKVKLIYQLAQEGKDSVEYESEVLLPIYESVYVKKFLIFKDEVLRYYFKETLGDVTIKSEKKLYRIRKNHKPIGKFGRLNDMISHPEKRDEMMTSYALEETLAGKMFEPYE